MSEAPPVEVTIREITELVKLFDDSAYSSLELDIHGMHLVLSKDGAPKASAPAAVPSLAAAPAAAPEPAPAEPARVPAAAEEPVPATTPAPAAVAAARSDASVEVRSPVVGSFWVAPSPGEPPFVQVGDHVDEGQQLAIVEVMKLMSHVSSPVAGVVTEVLAANADMVEYDQVLFIVTPDD